MTAARTGTATRLQVRHSCPACGKRCYPKRKAARLAARRLYPGKHMREYQCGGFWHLTSQPRSPQGIARRPAARPDGPTAVPA